MIFSADIDLFKEIADCRGVSSIEYRLSSSGLGFHVRWKCSKRTCQHCKRIEKKLDDPKRYELDHGPRGQKRNKQLCGNPRLLFDHKGNRVSGAWKMLTISREHFATARRVQRKGIIVTSAIVSLLEWQNP